MAKKYKPVDHDIEVKGTTVYGTRDNDIFRITTATEDGVEIVPGNQATDSLYFDMELDDVSPSHLAGTKDLIITYASNDPDADEKTLIIKNWFSSKNATAAKSSLKNIHYVWNGNTYNLSILEDLLFTDLYTINETKHKVTGSNFADYVNLNGKDSSYTVNGGNGNDYIIGSAQADTLNGGNGDDTIYGKNGDDVLTGGKGTNTYNYDADILANGNDTINLTKGETAKITYAGNLSNVGYKLDGKGNTLIYFDNTDAESNYITLKDFAKKDLAGEVKFISPDKVENLKDTHWYYAPTGDFNGTYLNDHIDAKEISNPKTDRNGKQIAYSFKTGSGNDIIESTNFADKITAGIGENEIRYTSLEQLDGDTIYLTKNENLTIDLTGISENNATATYSLSGKNLIVTVSDGSPLPKSFTIADFGTKDVTGANGKVTLIDKNGVTDLKEGAFIVVDGTKGTFHNDIISGGVGNNTIKGAAGDDTITGGDGNDKLYGESGANTFVFNAGDGADTVYGGDGVDTLEFSGISISTLQLSRGTAKNNKNDLIIKYSENDYVTVKDYYAVNSKTKLPTTSVKYITTTEGTFYIDPSKIITGEGEIDGDNNANFILGSKIADTIRAFDGDDTIYGGEGNDAIYGGDGDDEIYGDADNDEIYGGDGNDYIDGGAGADSINGGAGNDIIYGDNGRDIIYGGEGDDIIYGGDGRDTIYGGDGDDIIYGGDGRDDDDDIYTGTGDDIIYAGGGNSINVTLVDSGNKTIVSGNREGVTDKGYDIVVFLNEIDLNNLKGHILGDDLVVSDSTGSSVILKNYFTEGHRVDRFQIQKKGDPTIGIDKLPIEITSGESEINGTDLKDSITATNINGAIINGYAGNDTIYGGAGNDTINAGTGTNTIVINTGNKIIENGGGVDTIVFNMETNLDNLIRYISGNNLVITDSEGNSATLLDYFQNSHSVTTVKVGDKTRDINNISVQAPNNYIVGTKNGDTLNGSINDDVIYGCEGNDTINGDAGNDTLIGGLGNDVINGDAGNDIIDGGDGADTINGGAGNNIIYLASGNKIIENGGGVDTIVFNNETNIDNLRGQVSGNDLVITDSTGTSATLTNYFTDDHSVSVLQVGYMTINIADLSNIITSDEAEINGTNLKDIITATNENGAIINGLAGNDIINGSAGDDTINGSAGTDTIYGGEGKDTIYGGDDDDAIYGNAGVDYLYGENGDDAIYGGDGADAIYSGTGADFISGGAGNNTIYLDSGNKTIVNGGGNDTLVYVNETDINNLKVSVSGNNLIITDSTGTSATLLNYSDGHSVSEIQLSSYMPRDINDFSNYIKSGESTINGTFFHDFITVTTDSSHQIYGKEGNDEIHGGNGANYIWGDYDEYSSNIGHDTIYGGDSNDHLYGRLGNDEIHGGGGDDSIYGDGDNDILYGDSGNDYINGGDGDDEIYGDDGADSLYGGAGDDTIYGGTDKDTIDGGKGNDSIEGGAGNDDVEGGGGNDTIYGDDGDDIIKGSDGNDMLYGGAGDDKYIQKANNLADYDEIYDEAGDNDSLEINYDSSDIILRFDVKVDASGGIIEADSKNMYITSTSDFGNAEKGVKVTDQFVSGHSIENIKTADNLALTTTQINQLRSDIAGWLHQNEFESVQDVLDSHDETAIGNLFAEFQNADWQQLNA